MSAMHAPPEDPALVPSVDSATRRRPTDGYIGEVLEGRYVLRSRIAASRLSRVYLAHQPRLDRDVVAKLLVVPDGPDTVGRFRERFEREATALARLTHPHIVEVYDHGVHDDIPYIVMEHLKGESLHDAIRGRTLPPAVALDVVDQVAQALDRVHMAGIVHRDIKPSNIFVERLEPGDVWVRLVDFGIAKDRADTTDLTGVDTVLGTPFYMAPEQALGERVDERADVYSLGIVLYRLLMGTTPFGRLRGAGVLLAHIQTPPPAFDQVRPDHDLPEAVEWTVARCLEKNPAERFADMREVRRALEVCRAALSATGEAPTMGLVEGRVVTEQTGEWTSGSTTLRSRPVGYQPTDPADLRGLVAALLLMALSLGTAVWMDRSVNQERLAVQSSSLSAEGDLEARGGSRSAEGDLEVREGSRSP